MSNISFNEQFYLSTYPDVAAAVSRGIFASGQAHYNANGRFEGRNPNQFFNTSEYLGRYPDVARAGVNPLDHFLRSGAAEGRFANSNIDGVIDANNNDVANEFNEQAYLNLYTDVAAQTGPGRPFASAYQHFVQFGQFEGRTGFIGPNGSATPISGPFVNGGSTGGQPNTGSTFTLTTGTDAPQGTTGNDTFLGTVDLQTATNSTLTASDRVDGAGGTADALNITTQGTTAIASATNGALVSGIEVVNLRAVGTGGVTLDANNVAGLTAFNSALSTDAVTVNNLQDPAVVTVTGNGSATNGNLTANYVATATSGDLVLSGGVTAGGVGVNGAGLTSLAIVSNGAADTTGAISTSGTPASVTIAAATGLTTTGLTVGTLAAGGQTLTISGAAGNTAATATTAAAAAVNLGTLDGDFVTVNASGLTAGGISATLASVTATVTGGAGADIITTGGVLTTGSVNAGAGTDRLVVAASADLATAALGAKYTGFEQLQVQNAQTVDLDNIAGITGVFLNDGAGTTVLNNLSAAQAGSITVLGAAGDATINVKGAATVGQIDTVGLTFNDGDTTLNEAATNTTFALTGVENLTVNAIDAATITQSAAASASLSSVTLSGAGNISFTTGNIATSNFNLNASASTGANTLSAATFATNGVSITGGTGVDTITGSGQNDVINGGAGNDVITGGAGADAMTGGAGNDQFIIGSRADTRAGFAAGDTTAANIDRVTDFVGNGAAAGDSFQLSGTADVFGTVLDFSATTTATVTAVTVATAADFTALTAAVQTASAGVASSGTVAQIYDVTVTAGNLAGRYMIVNDDTAAVAATDTIVSLTGITGALNAQDFTFTA
ncbi:hypothetical protein ASG43_20640 [Aureimonas sp. Leaf454]|uniref:beta strand repeat-containing protein n=1 Tax=Aureimonas sp. Leaf454 TaxID=1736381 RepID=UPI0006F1E4C5|nr:calcium-binding protein [Aureimonas sp. Leaf454]KQT51990.1 hypothetical protein ASG43_20640 [Aureimonas sp. Leaf454]